MDSSQICDLITCNEDALQQVYPWTGTGIVSLLGTAPAPQQCVIDKNQRDHLE